MGTGRLRWGGDNLELEIPLHRSYPFLHRHYRLLSPGRMALQEAEPKLVGCPHSGLVDFVPPFRGEMRRS